MITQEDVGKNLPSKFGDENSIQRGSSVQDKQITDEFQEIKTNKQLINRQLINKQLINNSHDVRGERNLKFDLVCRSLNFEIFELGPTKFIINGTTAAVPDTSEKTKGQDLDLKMAFQDIPAEEFKLARRPTLSVQ